jgi:muramoyltetrapeptide carboxypeptidase
MTGKEYSLFLKPGSTLGLFSPASSTDPAEFQKLWHLAQTLGFNLKRSARRNRPQGYLAGTDASRFQELQDMMLDPEVDALWAVRGGYGCMRLLPDLENLWSRFPSKPIIGFSDLTALHLARWQASRTPGWHAPMLVSMDEPGRRQSLAEGLSGPLKPWKFLKKNLIRAGEGSGPLLGGNLSLVLSLLGTPYFPDCRGAILLLEDRGENLYRLDRMLTALRLNGLLGQLSGLVLGDFGQKLTGPELKPLFRYTAEYCRGPVVWLPCFGHGLENRPWPFGGLAELRLGGRQSCLEFADQ